MRGLNTRTDGLTVTQLQRFVPLCLNRTAVARTQHTALSRTLGRPLLRGSRVTRRLPGRHSSVTARPLRCRSFCDGQRLKKATTLVPSRWSFARRQMLDTSLEQYAERLSHDRTTERHWQRLGCHRATVPKEVPRGSSTPAAAHATSPRAVAVRLSSVPFLGGGRPSWSGGLLSVHHRRIAPTAQ